MSYEVLIALMALAITMTWTPGPNNMMLAASGAVFGFRPSLPHAAGVAIGFPAMLLVVALGTGPVFGLVPWLATALGWAGLLVVLWFAWKIATADPADSSTTAARRPMTFGQAAAFQWINPKAWTFAIWVSASYATGADAVPQALAAAAIFLVSGSGSTLVWLMFGSAMRAVIGQGPNARRFNIAMAVLLAVSALWITLAA